MNHPISIIGMGMSTGDLTAAHLERILGADLLVGGRRHLDAFPEYRGETYCIRSPLSELVERLNGRGTSNVVVLASGDPLFFGIGGYLVDRLGRDAVEIFPNINSVSAAFSRIKSAWHDAAVISLHGRAGGQSELCRAVARHAMVAVYTDPEQGPAVVARWLLENGWSSVHVWVCECMGTDDERVARYSPADAAVRDYRDPCMVVVERSGGMPAAAPAPVLGRPDDAFEHENGLITKQEVRAVILSLLRFSDHHVFWDLGAGSGAVSAEAGALVRQGRIAAVEKNPDRVSHIKHNLASCGVVNAQVVLADLPDGLSQLPDPDRVFIGGGGKNLATIVAETVTRLRPGGRVMVSAVMLESVHTAVHALENAGLEPEVTMIQVSRGRRIAGNQRLEALNPVWLIHAAAKEKE